MNANFLSPGMTAMHPAFCHTPCGMLSGAFIISWKTWADLCARLMSSSLSDTNETAGRISETTRAQDIAKYFFIGPPLNFRSKVWEALLQVPSIRIRTQRSACQRRHDRILHRRPRYAKSCKSLDDEP